MSRSIESISHKLDPLAEALLPTRRAHFYRSAGQVITPDGRLRADKLDGFVPPDKVPTIGLEFVGEATADLDFPSIGAQTSLPLTITVDGARTNDAVILGGPDNMPPNLIPFGHVTADDTVTIRMYNLSASSSDPGVRTWHVLVVR